MLKIDPILPKFGAEVSGVDISRHLSDASQPDDPFAAVLDYTLKTIEAAPA